MIHLLKAALLKSGNTPGTPVTSSSSLGVRHPWDTKSTLRQTTMNAYASSASRTSSSYQSSTNTTLVSGPGSSYQPTIITLAQLQANRAAVQRSNNFIEYVTSSDLTVGWSDYSATVTEYLDKLGFHTTDERRLKINDSVVLICDTQYNRDGNNDIMQYAHAQYTVDHISLAGTVVHLHYRGMLNESSAQSSTPRQLPAKLTIHVLHDYILLKEQSNADQIPSPSLYSRQERGAEGLHAGNNPPTNRGSVKYRPHDIDEWTSLGRADSHPAGDVDARSEDSEARKHTKSSFLQVGHSRVEVLGKNTVHDHILQTTALRTLQEEGRLKLFLTAGGHGYFGNNYTPQNIIQGLLQYDSVTNEPVTLSSQLHASLNHARALLLQQAWYKHEELHKKIALCEFEQGFTVSPHSIHCAHLLPAKIAEENNYEIVNWMFWLLHMEGWKILFQELLGPSYGTTLQAIITEARERRIGEMSNIVYLVQLTHHWRAELYKCAKSVVPFQLPRHATVYLPQKMKPADWNEVMNIQWNNIKEDINPMDEFVYLQGLRARNLGLPKAFGHKPKKPADEKPIQGKVVVPAAPVKARAKDNKKKTPPKDHKSPRDPKPQRDQKDALCVADLLSHYGAGQQIACDVPCRYPHYGAIAKGTTKAAVINKVQVLGPKLHLTDSTINFLKKKIDEDAKFK